MANQLAQINFDAIRQVVQNNHPAWAIELQPARAPDFWGLVNLILPYLFVIAGLVLFFYLISGGLGLILAAGNPEGIKDAKGKITNALMGFLLLFTSFWLTQIVSKILGAKLI